MGTEHAKEVRTENSKEVLEKEMKDEENVHYISLGSEADEPEAEPEVEMMESITKNTASSITLRSTTSRKSVGLRPVPFSLKKERDSGRSAV